MTTVSVTEKPSGDHILVTPIWLLVIRGFQFLISLICLALAGNIMADVYLDEFGLNIAATVLTWVIIAYIVLTEKVPALQVAYHIIAVLALEAFMVVIWLATFAATAARRGSFKYTSSLSSCFDGFCIKKRDVYFYEAGLKKFSAIAGMGAIVWLLFIVSFVWTTVMFFKGRKQGHFQFGSSTGTTNNYQLESKAQAPAASAPIQPTQSPYEQPQYQQSHGVPTQTTYAPQDQQAYGQYPAQPYQQPPPAEAAGTHYQVPHSAGSPPPHPQ